jgi:RNA polymerase sigma-B factor
VVTSSVPSAGTEPGVDAHLVALQRRYARLAGDDPQRPRVREELIRGYLSVAEHLARRFAGRGEPLDDLVQVAAIGLINAVDRFEPDRGVNFLSFAVPTITGELRRYFRDHGWSTRVPRALQELHMAIRNSQTQLSQQLGRAPRPSDIAGQLGIPVTEVIEGLQVADAYHSASLDELLGDHGDVTVGELVGDLDNDLAIIEDRETLRPVLAQLPPRERTILMLRFFCHLTQTQIAEQVGMSQMHVSRILSRTLAFLQEAMAQPD